MPVKFVLICGIVLELKKVLDRKKKKKKCPKSGIPLVDSLNRVKYCRRAFKCRNGNDFLSYGKAKSPVALGYPFHDSKDRLGLKPK